MAAPTILESAGGETGTPGQAGVHVDALDGLRGVAVAAVVVFHAAPAGWLRGGFLGVSLFFTLSGYLITGLALREVEATGRLAVGAFYARRVRRLVPALISLVVGIVVLGRVVDVAARTERQAIGGLTYLSNWLQIRQQVSYAELWEGPGVLDHLWSLAIEEQWYLLFPLLIAGIVRWRGGGLFRSTLAWTLLGVVAVSVVGALVASDHNLIYLATHTRLGEIAVGGLLALAAPLGSARPSAGAQRIGEWAMGGLIVAFALTTLQSGWLYAGLLPGFAVLSAAVINAAVRPGRLAGVLSVPPLRRLGLISYGLYLYHWPISVEFSAPRLGWPPVVLFVVRVVVSLAAAEASYRWIEAPIRHRRMPDARTVRTGVAVLGLATVMFAVIDVIPGAGKKPPAASAAPVIRVLGSASSVAPLAERSGDDAPAVATPTVVTAAPTFGPTPAGSGQAVTIPSLDGAVVPPPGTIAPGTVEPAGPGGGAPATLAPVPIVPAAGPDGVIGVTAGSIDQPAAASSTRPSTALSTRPSPAPTTPASRQASTTAVVRPGPSAVSAPSSSAPAAGGQIVVFGDSVADWLLRDGEGVTLAAGWSVIDAAVEGCDGARGMPDGRANNGTILAVPPDCPAWPEWYPATFDLVNGVNGRPPVAVMLPGQAVIVDRVLDGKWVGPCSAEMRAWYHTDIADRLALLTRIGARPVVVLPAWSTDTSRWIYPDDHVARVDCVRAIIEQAAAGHPSATVIDLADKVCPAGPTACAALRTRDGVHFDPEAAPDVLAWLIDRITATPTPA